MVLTVRYAYYYDDTSSGQNMCPMELRCARCHTYDVGGLGYLESALRLKHKHFSKIDDRCTTRGDRIGSS